jgi:uncharacterized protein (DUF58 family)
VQVHPTSTTVDIAVAGIVSVAVGLLAREPAIVAWGGALIVGLAIARSVTRLGVGRIRAAGFEMLWQGRRRVERTGRRERVELAAEIRNRDSRAARFVRLRTVSSPDLDVRIEPTSGEVPAGGRLAVSVTIDPLRVGRHGVHGISLEVQGSPGLFEVPLTFANPYGIDVMPGPFGIATRSPRGGRSRMTAPEGRPGPLTGDGSELRELREHLPGDAFKRIAWKASARRGQLFVREYEREERDVVWLLLDASVDLWAGKTGSAPLDHAIDEVAAVAVRHIERGDRVGLLILGGRVLARIEPNRGPRHGVELMRALAHTTGCTDSDRSGLDETEVALRVLEHMRPLDPAGVTRVGVKDLDRVARRAERVRMRAPFGKTEPFAPSRRERILRRYLDAFGIRLPARLQTDRPETDFQLARALKELTHKKPRASIVYVWSPPPEAGNREPILSALSRIGRRFEVRWVSMTTEAGIATSADSTGMAVADAVSARARAARERGERALRQLGVRVERLGRRAPYSQAG